MRGLNHQLKQLCRHNREGSYGTQVQRERELTLMANQLHQIGYRGMNSHSLKPKHVEALVRHWLKTGVATGTIKNRMSAFRWWARKVNRQNVVARSNDHYGIPNRIFVTNRNKAKSILEVDLAKVRDEHVRMSLELQQAFGLRMEESIKFIPTYADQGDHLVLKPVIVKVPVASVNKLMRPCPTYYELRFGQFYWDSDKPPAPVASFSFVDSNVPDVVPLPPGKAPVVAPRSRYPVRHDVVPG